MREGHTKVVVQNRITHAFSMEFSTFILTLGSIKPSDTPDTEFTAQQSKMGVVVSGRLEALAEGADSSVGCGEGKFWAFARSCLIFVIYTFEH